MQARSQGFLLTLILGLALTGAGCGSKSDPAPTQAKKPTGVKKTTTPADNLSPNLVTAVTTGKNGATLLQVKFEVAARPAVGDPVDVDLVIVPASDNIDRISGTVQGADGLEVVSGETIDPVEKLAYGTPIHHALKIRAKRDGIFTLSAAVTIETGGQSLGPIYSMPIMAGNGLADTGTPPGPTPGAAKPAPRASAQ